VGGAAHVGGVGSVGGARVGGVGGVGHNNGYGGGYGRGGVGFGIGIGVGAGLYGGYYAGYPIYSSFYNYAPPPVQYPYPYPYPDQGYPQNGVPPGMFPPGGVPPQQGPPMPLPTYDANNGAPRQPTPNPLGDNIARTNEPANAKSTSARNQYIAPVQLEVLVPDANAQLFVDGTLTSTKGNDRIFVTAPLEMGYAYAYNVRVVWNQDGQQVVRERQVQVAPGVSRTIDFNIPDLPSPSVEGN
jgi:uncharacterized protein (TIGR03000 family)